MAQHNHTNPSVEEGYRNLLRNIVITNSYYTAAIYFGIKVKQINFHQLAIATNMYIDKSHLNVFYSWPSYVASSIILDSS